jgi:hypothetical protein
MKKILLGILLWCMMPFVFSQDAGFVSGFAIINKNGAGNEYLCLTTFNCGTNSDFHNHDFGLVVLDTDSFILNGAEINNYTCNFQTITPVSLYFRVYREDETPGAFTLINIFLNTDSPFTYSNGCNGANMRWETFAHNQNILDGIAIPGNYYLELYVQQETSIGTQYLSNGGLNYRARFEVVCSVSPLNGTYDIPSPCFPTMASAVNYLNTYGVSGPVTFNVAAGYTETAPPGGFRITGTGTAANPVVFQKSGVGANPTFTASSFLTAGNRNDAIFKLVGADYITLDGFTLLENPANTVLSPITSNTMTEFGVALFYESTTNGAQHITIQNCVISLNRDYRNSFGIYSNSTHSDSINLTSATAISVEGNNNNLQLFGNNISNVNIGIVVVGAQAENLHQNGLIIGGSSTQGNSVTNYGKGNTLVNPNNVSSLSNGIYLKNVRNFDISYNIITSNDAGIIEGQHRGIFINSPNNVDLSNASVNNISNNSFSISSGVNSPISGIECQTTAVNNLSTLNINNNTFSNFGHAVSATANINFIFNSSHALNVSISGNSIINNTVNTSGRVDFINNSNPSRPDGSVYNINNNTFENFTKSTPGNTLWGYNSGTTATTNAVTEIINGNTFENITVSGATAFNGIASTWGSNVVKTVNNNSFNNITGGSGNVVLLNVNSNLTGGTIAFNTISNITSGAEIRGIDIGAGTQNVFKNTIHSMTTSATAVSGIRIAGGSGYNLYQNKIYGLQSNATGTTSQVYGITVTTGANIRIYNNVVGDLRAPLVSAVDAIRGISLTTGTFTNTFIDHNTIFLNASSTGTNFGTSGLFLSGNTNAIANNHTLRNNLVVNLSTPRGTGRTAAFRRSTVDMDNYNINSDRNAFYVGTPSANRVVFLNFTTPYQTLENFQAFVSPREQNSVYEEPVWASTNGVDANYLKLQDGPYPSQMESGGLLVTTPVTIDFDHVDEVRPGGVGVVNDGGQQVDIGAYEFDARPFDRIPPVITYTPLTGGCGQPEILLNNVQITDIHPGATGVVTSGALVPRAYYRQLPSGSWQSQPGTLTSGDAFDGLWSFTITGLSGGDLEYFVIAQDNNANLSAEPGEGLVASDVLTITTYPDFPEELYFPVAIWAGSWIPDDAAPTAQTRVVIMAPYNTSIHGSFVACDCIVEAGASVVIASNDHITLQGGLNNQGSFTIQSSGSLVQVFDQPNVGSITVERIANNVSKYDFIYWSSPVNNYALSGIPGSSSRFRWDPVAPNSNGGLGNWISYSGIMEAGRGYIVRAPNSSPIAPATTTLFTTFTGVPHNGTVPVTIERGNMTTATVPSFYSNPALSIQDDNFNLVGNPYPSAIHAEDFLIHNTITNPVLDGTLRLWTHGTVPDTGQSNPFFGDYTYNYSPNDYIIFNLTGTISGPAGFGGYVASGQGFFVLMNEGEAATATVEFTNAMRSSGYGNNQFYRMNYLTSSMPSTKHRIWLDLVNSNGSSVRTLVGYIPGATYAKDVLYDAWVKPGNHLNLYSLADGETLAIQGRSVPFQTEDLVPLGFVAPQAGNYSITIAYADGVFAPQNGQFIYLEDKLTQTVHLLNSGPYSFYTESGRDDGRFVLRYEYETLSTPGFQVGHDLQILSVDEYILIRSEQTIIQKIELFDILGRTLLKSDVLSSQLVQLNYPRYQQVMLVRVLMQDGTTANIKIIH